MFPWPMGMVIGSLLVFMSSESTIPHSLRESGLDSGAQARPVVTVVYGGNGAQNFFHKHTGDDL